MAKPIPFWRTSDSRQRPIDSCSSRAGMMTWTSGAVWAVSIRWVYYTVVKLPRFLLSALLALLLAGCERGPSPRMIGSAAPDFTIKDSDHTVALHELRGKLVVLNFWAAHFGPFTYKIPSPVPLQTRLTPSFTLLRM